MIAKLKSKIVALLCLLVFTASALADYELGRKSLLTRSAPALRRTDALTQVLGRARPTRAFVRAVGGVAFDGVARPADGLEVETFSLDYDRGAEDGRRLVATINGQRAVADVYDWELVPIAKYADSGESSCFTLFGELDDEEEQAELQRRGARILNYSSAFEDTLIGLRLFQLDVLMLGEDFATELPAERGRYVLGKGEAAPNVKRNQVIFKRYDRSLEELRTSLQGAANVWYRSYVICDRFQDIRFSILDGSIQITGEPYYYFVSWPLFGEDGEATYLKRFSEAHTSLVPLLANVNPQVWSAGRKTMRYGALFRYCKKNAPGEWREFMAAVNAIELGRAQPRVKTPTVLQLTESE